MLYQCSKFHQKPLMERRSFVFKNKRCYNCFGSHTLKECKSQQRCKECLLRHHSLLHDATWKPNSSALLPAGATSRSNELDVASTIPKPQVMNPNAPLFQSANASAFQGVSQYFRKWVGVLLGTTRVIIEGPNGNKVVARALIDNGSQPSFISEELCKRLGMNSVPTSSSISAVGGVQVVTPSRSASFTLRPHFKSKFACRVGPW